MIPAESQHEASQFMRDYLTWHNRHRRAAKKQKAEVAATYTPTSKMKHAVVVIRTWRAEDQKHGRL